jgi:hypothetical protein
MALAVLVFQSADLSAANPLVRLVDDTAMKNDYQAKQGKLLLQGRYDELEAEADRVRTSREHFPDGLSKLFFFSKDSAN